MSLHFHVGNVGLDDQLMVGFLDVHAGTHGRPFGSANRRLTLSWNKRDRRETLKIGKGVYLMMT
jgi:hypothetical protein